MRGPLGKEEVGWPLAEDAQLTLTLALPQRISCSCVFSLRPVWCTWWVLNEVILKSTSSRFMTLGGDFVR